MRWAVLAALLLGSTGLGAAPWELSERIAVTPVHGPGIFHHLESAGRSNVAVSGDSIAVVWEDNRDGKPQVRIAFKSSASDRFTEEYIVSAGEPAYEPAIAALGAGHFLVAWEENDAVWLRRAGLDGLGPVTRAGGPGAAQPALGAAPQGTAALAWSQRDGSRSRIMVAEVSLDRESSAPQVSHARPADAEPPRAEQLYPSVVRLPERIVVAWEDRRSGHTRLFFSHAAGGQPFAPPQSLNETRDMRDVPYGKGSGAARVALTRLGDDRVAAVWMDKRAFFTGYHVYAAFSADGGRTFGANEKVQDVFGDDVPQWHPAIAGNASGRVAIAWDDDRQETADIWLSWPEDGQWSDDHAVAPASGPAEQTSPTLALDEAGNLHIAWLEQQAANGPTRLWYAVGRLQGAGQP